MSKKINDKAELTVPYDAYVQMKLFAWNLWHDVRWLKDEVPCYGYYEKVAEELGIDDEGEAV